MHSMGAESIGRDGLEPRARGRSAPSSGTGSRSAGLSAGAALVAAVLALASCSRGEVLYLSDPAWETLRPGASADIERGLEDAGFRVRKSTLPMADPHGELFAAVNAFKGGKVALTPLLGLEAEGLVAAFPGKVAILPGSPLSVGSPAVSVSRSDRIGPMGSMGRAAAAYMAKVLEGMGGGKDAPKPIAFAYAVFLDSMAEEAAAFRAGYSGAAEGLGLPGDSLILETCPDDKTAGEALSRGVFSRDVRFLFIAAGQSSRFFAAAVPSRLCVAAGLEVESLAASSPSLAASLEEDFRTHAAAAARPAGPGGSGSPRTTPLRFVPLRKELARLIPYEPARR